MPELTSQNPQHTAYYYPVIISYIGIFIIIQTINYFYNEQTHKIKERLISLEEDEKNLTKEILQQKENLKIKYLVAYCLTRASIWAKSPYLYTLYNKYHGFSVSEIGILYVIDAISGLISGPIFGSLADKFGRKLFCMNYCIFVITNLSLRLTGIKSLAYIAQILTGFGSSLINTTFESWVVFEAQKIFQEKNLEKEKFLKKLFKNQNLYDAIISLLVTGISAIVYTYFGIIITIIFAMCYSILALILIFFLWEENRPNFIQTENHNYMDALRELKKRDVLSIGFIESIFQACLNLFIFVWTPLLQRSTDFKEINVGFIFVCYVLMMIIGTGFFDLFVISLKFKFYPCMIISLFVNLILWYLVYIVDNFMMRLIFLSIINGICGFYLPLNSIIKSKILVEKHRATLMSIFRVPVNAYVIIILLCLKFMDAFTICLIATIMMLFAFIIAFSLYLFPTKKIEINQNCNLLR